MKKLYTLFLLVTSSLFINAQCDYTLTMIDSWGDGWNGNTIDVIVNGTAVLDDVTLASGNSGDLTFTVNTGDAITTLWNGGGSYGSETSYEIKDVAGAVVGSGAQTSISTAITANCPSCSPVSAASASNITVSSADIGWTAGGTEGTWNIEYGTSGFTQGSGTALTSGATDISTQTPGLFAAGPNATWTNVYTACVTGDGNNGAQQTMVINVTSLPAGGANRRIVKTTANGNWFQGNAVALTLGTNTINVTSVAFDRSVKIQFSSGAIGFDAISLNGNSVYSGGSSISLSGLSPATAYDVYIQADCGGGNTSPSTLVSFSTSIPAPSGVTCSTGNPGFIFSDDMDANQGWSGDIGTSNGQWDFPTAGPGGNSANTGPSAAPNAASGSTWAEYEASGNSSTIASLVSPMIDLATAQGEAELSFYFHAYGASTGTLNVGVGGSAAGPFTNVFSSAGEIQTAATDPWTHVGVDISSYLGQQIYIEFSYGGTGGGYAGDLALDFVQVETCQNCLAPSGLTASNITPTSADLSWTAGGTETVWELTYGAQGFTPGSGTLVPMLAATSHSLTGLSDNTSYDYYVKADCGGGDLSGWAGPYTFTTPCSAIAAPFSEGFSASLPSCWSMSGGENWLFNTSGPNHVGNGGTISGSTSSGGHYAVIDASGYSGGAGSSLLITPNIDVSSLTSAELTFFLISNEEGTGYSSTLTVEANGGSTWDTVGSYTGNTNGWENKIIDLSAYSGNVQLRFGFSELSTSSAYFDDIAIDDIDVHEAPSCADPTSLTASNNTDSSVDLSWTAGGTETAWNIEHGPAGFAQGSGTVVPVTAASYSLTGLNAITAYEYYVQSDCGAGSLSGWVGPFSFNTTVANGCSHVLNMYDSFGDGWNGNAVDVTINGVAVVSGATIPSGSSATASFSAATGSTITLSNWITGGYTSEVSWDIADVNGNVIASGVHGDLGTATGNCTVSHTVTFSVNTANITVGANGMYAGGGVLGDAMAVALSDPDGDGTWTGDASIADGTTGNYIFLNSPTSGGDWGAKEVLSGLPCSDPANFDDRILPAINGDTTLLHCFGSCESDGTCPLPPVQSNVTFAVDMSQYTGSQSAPYTVNLNGTFNGWCGGCNAMDDSDGDNVWEVTIPLDTGSSIEYKFTVNGWNDQENFMGGEPCTVTNGGFTNRSLAVPPADATLPTVCYNSCTACPAAPPALYAITFSVNTASITVGANGMYAGGGALGDAMAVPLSDPDGDGTWTGVDSLAAGTVGNYIFLNSPTSGGDWGAKEDLTGLPCADPNNWNDRILPAINGDTTLLHCFGSCESDGTCPSPPPAGGCHYVIDMQDSWGDGWNGASVDVSVNGTVLANWALASGSAGSDSIATLVGDQMDFSFNSGSYDSEITFTITDPAGNVLGTYGTSPATGSFLTHTSNATCVPATVNVTFQVDMNQVTAGFTTPEVNGTWNSWCGNCNPMTDANADGVWEATIPLLSGAYEYKFSADSWTIQEMNDPSGSCTNGDPVFTNRVLSVGTSDMTLSVVCWGSCTPCFYSPQPPVGVTCTSGNPGLAYSDDCEAVGGWTGDISPTYAFGIWNLGSGGTPSTGTGPSGAHSGSGYLYYETSGTGGDTGTVVTPMVDLTAAIGSAELTFWMYANGATIGTLDVGVSTSATGPFTSLFTSTGEVQTPTDPWAQIGVDMTSYVGQAVYVGFTYIKGASYTGDIAIDLVEVNSCFNCLAPSGLASSNVTATSADVSWTPGGTEPEWFLIVNGVGSVETSSTVSLSGLTANTSYTCQVHAICAPGDTSVASPAYTFTTPCNIAIAPTNENFDAGFSNCWSQDTADVFDWSVGNGGTPSGGTGPSDDFTGGGNYMFVETSVPRAHGDSAIMHSEQIDISGLTNPELRFLSHMYGDAMGTMRVDMWDGSAYSNVFTKSGDQGNVWNEELIMLSTTASVVQFKVTAILDTNAGGQAWTGDMAVDEFGVREAAANDLAIVAAVASSGCDLTNAEPVEVWVVNQGLVAESAFDLSYAVNGGTPVVENITSTLNPGDTLMYVFTATADMSADGVYDVDLECVLSTDTDPADNLYSTSGENYFTPAAPTTMGDTICIGDSTIVTADEYSYWYDAATGGNLIGEGDELDVMPTATTSYYAEAVAIAGHSEDFDSYMSGDFIAASDPSNWATWSGTSADDMPISDLQGNGGNSLRVFNSDGSDVVLEFGEAFSTGKFYYAMDMYMVADGYINFQEQVSIGAAWNMSITFVAGVINIDVDGASVFQGTYSGTDPMGNPVWNTFEFECDYDNGGLWEVFVNGNSQGTFVNPDPVASVNVYPGAGVEYYLDNVEWAALKGDACTSATRTEAVVTVEECSNINELSRVVMDLYPNPSNGEFVVTASENMISINITDVQGKVVYTVNDINVNKLNVDQAGLEKGMYMVNIETTNGTITKSLIVQ